MPSVKVFLVDDSAVIRTIIGRQLRQQFDFEIVGTAANGREALERIPVFQPDVVVMDVEMPVLNGISTLRELMATKPVPVVMLSAHTHAGSKATIEALALGAVDFVPKPGRASDIFAIVNELGTKIQIAAGASLRSVDRISLRTRSPRGLVVPPPRTKQRAAIVVIGCSTGGPNALRVLLPSLPADLSAAVVVVQHMPAGFTSSLAEHLDAMCAIRVRHALDNDPVVPGQVLVAPAGKAFRFSRDFNGIRAGVKDDSTPLPPGRFRPSVDEVMTQAAAVYGNLVLGVLLTGMGRDGAEGMKAIQMAEGYTIAQDEDSCVVYGMPRAAVEAGAARRVLPLTEIAAEIVRQV